MICDQCHLEKPDDEMATVATNDPEGLGESEVSSLHFCSVECMTAWFIADSERMRKGRE
jgi:hypothetical protein